MADQQNEGFVRQRRNLMIVSLVLLFFEATELKVERISAFGTEMLVGQSQAVTMALWVAALYWLVRFYQYSRTGYHMVLRQAVNERIREYEVCAPVALKRVLRKEPSLLEPFHDVESIPSIECVTFEMLSYDSKHLDVQLGLKKTATDGQRSVSGTEKRKVRLDGASLFWLRVRSWIHLILHTTLFTELMLPYIVFTLPVLYGGYKVIRQLT